MVEDAPVHAFKAHYQKSNFFRVIHADGCYGGPTPRGLMSLAFYNERGAIPRVTSTPIVNGSPGKEEVVETKGGIVREIEIDVLMDFNSAVVFHTWLGNNLTMLKELMGITDEQMAQLRGQQK